MAQAELARVKAGFRAETIAVRKAETERAEADLTLAQQTYDRKRTLVALTTLRVADLDRATATLAVAERGAGAGAVRLQRGGLRLHARGLGIAQSKVEAAQAGVETLKSLVDQMVVVAPADSQVFRIPIEDGEFVLPGIPLITLVDLADMWVQFDLREDLLRDIKAGLEVRRAGAGARRSRRRARGPRDRRQGRIHRLARDALERRFRPAHVRDPRLSDAAVDGLRPG